MRSILVIAIVTGVVACDSPVRTDEGSTTSRSATSLVSGGLDVAIPVFPEIPEVIPEKRLEGDMGLRHRALSDAELIKAVRAADGLVTIGIKPVTAAHSAASRKIAEINRAQIIEARDVLTRNGAELIKTFRHVTAVVARIDPESAPAIRELPVVDYVAPRNFGFSTALAVPRWYASTPAHPVLYADQDTSWGVHKIGADSVWAASGNQGEYATITALDYGPSQNHYLYLDGPENLTNCVYVAYVTNTCWGTFDHGAFVAGVANGRDNSVGYIGVAPSLFAYNSVKVFTSSGVTTDQAVADGLDWAIDLGIPRQIVNLSIGFCEDYEILADAVSSAVNAGILVVAGVGNIPNSGTECESSVPGTTGVVFPARYPGVIAVSGTMPDDGFANTDTSPCDGGYGGGSRYGSQVLLSAPFWAYSMTGADTWGIRCGTSFAAPTVAAVAALVWSDHTSWSAAQVRSRLIETAVDLGTSGRDDYFGWGRVSAMQAVSLNPTVTITGKTSVKPNVTCSWDAMHSLPLPPYTFNWTKNGSTVGYSSTLTLSTGSSSFTLGVVVTNAAGSSISDTHSVTVTSGATNCFL
jgi:hypothetical protein